MLVNWWNQFRNTLPNRRWFIHGRQQAIDSMPCGILLVCFQITTCLSVSVMRLHFPPMNRIPVRTDVSGHSGHECLRWFTCANHAPNTRKYRKTQFTFLNRCFLCNVKVIIWKGKSPPLGLYDRKRYIMGLWKRSSLYPL